MNTIYIALMKKKPQLIDRIVIRLKQHGYNKLAITMLINESKRKRNDLDW